MYKQLAYPDTLHFKDGVKEANNELLSLIQQQEQQEQKSSFENTNKLLEAVAQILKNKGIIEPQIDFTKVEMVKEGFDPEQLIKKKISEQKDPENNAFFIVNLSDVVLKRRQWNMYFPRVEPFYAVKCNPDPEIVKCLAMMGVNFDCASKAEMDVVTSIGVSTDRIIFSNPCKQKSHITYARDIGVNLTVFDNVAELNKIKECHPQCKLLIRVCVDDRHSICQFSQKFGAKEQDFHELLSTAKSLNLNLVGVSFHVGSGCYDLNSYSQALEVALKVFKMGSSSLFGFKMNILDIGGGFPGSWDIKGDDGSGVTFQKIAGKMQPLLDEMFPNDKVRVIAEPGRYFVASSHTLAVNIIGLRKIELENNNNNTTSSKIKNNTTNDNNSSSSTTTSSSSDNDISDDESISSSLSPKISIKTPTITKKFSYYVNDGLYGSFNNIMFDHAIITPLVLNRNSDTSTKELSHSSTIFGPTCDGLDCIVKDTLLPELKVGDWLYFLNMGAYTKAAASQFNGFQISTSHYYLSSREFLC